jgi:hypothetical protein
LLLRSDWGSLDLERAKYFHPNPDGSPKGVNAWLHPAASLEGRYSAENIGRLCWGGMCPSGAKTDRAQLRRVLAQLEAGDVLIVPRLDRLARSTRDL